MDVPDQPLASQGILPHPQPEPAVVHEGAKKKIKITALVMSWNELVGWCQLTMPHCMPTTAKAHPEMMTASTFTMHSPGFSIPAGAASVNLKGPPRPLGLVGLATLHFCHEISMVCELSRDLTSLKITAIPVLQSLINLQPPGKNGLDSAPSKVNGKAPGA